MIASWENFDCVNLFLFYLFLELNDDLEQMQHWLNKATEEKKDHLISKDLINFIKLKTKPDFMQIKVSRVLCV